MLIINSDSQLSLCLEESYRERIMRNIGDNISSTFSPLGGYSLGALILMCCSRLFAVPLNSLRFLLYSANAYG